MLDRTLTSCEHINLRNEKALIDCFNDALWRSILYLETR